VADNARRDAEAQAAREAEKQQKRIDESAKAQSKELEEANKQAELAQARAEAARQEVEQAKRQAVEEARRQVQQAVEQAKGAANENTEKVAALTADQPEPPALPASAPKIGEADIARLLQAHLKRVGCNSGKIDGVWDEGSQRSLELFNKNAKTKFDTKVASLEALDAVRNETDRVCPLICSKGERAAGDHCVQIGCADGYYLDSSGSCERRRHEASPRQRSMAMRPMKPRALGSLGPGGFAPALPSAAPLGGSCALDSSGHRQGGRFCRD
jgi:hypothetical protein